MHRHCSHHELNEAFPSLVDENGDRKSFERFLNDVRAIDETYNANYLRAEYNFAVSSAEMAAKWEGFLRDGDRYNLQYRTQNDDRVRPEHAALDRVTLPMSDPFWEEYYPPNGWNCRCTVVQVRKSKYPQTPHDEAMRLGEQALQKDSKGIFRFNPGIEDKTFPDYNPYTIRRCRDCDIAKGKQKFVRQFIPENNLCEACILLHSMLDREGERKLSKEERKEVASAANEWAERHLPKIPNSDGTLMSRLSTVTANGDTVHIGKQFFSETFAKNKRNRKLAETIKLATQINEWIGNAVCIGTEPGRHHAFDFRIYEVEYKGQKIQLKAKVTEGIIAYNMRLI
ncbi:MAG: minor capsid protein [Muribaculaceae bacterium]|nr:minor capsid protein [Muribaculaceae bacterium]